MAPTLLTDILDLCPEGATMRYVCPSCGGGADSERSFVVTREQGVAKYICHRASCGVRGQEYRNSMIESRPSKKPPPPRYSGQVLPAPISLVEYLAKKYHMRKSEVVKMCKWDDEQQRAVFPVRGPRGQLIGNVLRAYPEYSPSHGPKSLLYREEAYEDIPKVHFPLQSARERYNPLVVVEDIVSAVKVSEYVPAVALLGVGLTQRVVEYFIRQGIKNLVLAYDNDALGRSIKDVKKYVLAFDSVRVLPLDKDFKDMTDKELREALSEYREEDYLGVHGQSGDVAVRKQAV